MKYAGFWIRLIANFVDTAILALISWGVGCLVFLGQDFNALSTQMGMGGIYSAVSLLYFSFMHFRYGTTVGKKILGIYVVREGDFKKLRLGQSVLRAVGYWLSWLPFGAGYLMVGLNSRKTALHDMLARSVSVRGIPFPKQG